MNKYLLISFLLILLVFSGCAARQARNNSQTTIGLETTLIAKTVVKDETSKYPIRPPYHPELLKTLSFNDKLAGKTFERTYFFHVPGCYKKGTSIPLVIGIHGGGGTGEAIEMQIALNAKADEACFIAVYPNSISAINIPGRLQYWNAGSLVELPLKPELYSQIDDTGFISAVISELEKEYSINPKMIYATGISNGAWMSYRLACELSDKIAAIAPVGGGMIFENCNPKNPVSIIHFHGTLDPGWPYNGGYGCFDDVTNREPISKTIDKWISLDKCSQDSKIIYQKGEVTCKEYSSCSQNSAIEFCTIEGGGHTYPGGFTFPLERAGPRSKKCDLSSGVGVGKVTQDIIARDAMWEFFKEHPRV